MTDYTFITVPGIGEPASADGSVVGMWEGVTSKLPARFHAQHFNWRNTYGPVPEWNGEAYAGNIEAARVDLIATANASTRPVVLAGYSGGGHVVSLAAQGVTNLAAIATIANPSRRVGDSSAPYYGITGQHVPFTVPVFDLANPADVICCCPDTSPLRDLYDLTQHFALAGVESWGRSLLKAAIDGSLTNSVAGATLSDWLAAIKLAQGYLSGKEHVRWYTAARREAFANSIAAALT